MKKSLRFFAAFSKGETFIEHFGGLLLTVLINRPKIAKKRLLRTAGKKMKSCQKSNFLAFSGKT
jgi:hypothetical protein